MEERSIWQRLEKEWGYKHKKSTYDPDQWTCLGRFGVAVLTGDHLDTVLQVNPWYVESKGITREQGDIFQKVAP